MTREELDAEATAIGKALEDAPVHPATGELASRAMRLHHLVAEQQEHMDELVRKLRELQDEVPKLRRQKDGAYAERNKLVALLAHMALALGWKAGVGKHPEEDESWERDWRTILFVEVPSENGWAQCAWHFHDSEEALLTGLPEYPGKWDGHTTPEKYTRVLEAMSVVHGDVA